MVNTERLSTSPLPSLKTLEPTPTKSVSPQPQQSEAPSTQAVDSVQDQVQVDTVAGKAQTVSFEVNELPGMVAADKPSDTALQQAAKFSSFPEQAQFLVQEALKTLHHEGPQAFSKLTERQQMLLKEHFPQAQQNATDCYHAVLIKRGSNLLRQASLQTLDDRMSSGGMPTSKATSEVLTALQGLSLQTVMPNDHASLVNELNAVRSKLSPQAREVFDAVGLNKPDSLAIVYHLNNDVKDLYEVNQNLHSLRAVQTGESLSKLAPKVVTFSYAAVPGQPEGQSMQLVQNRTQEEVDAAKAEMDQQTKQFQAQQLAAQYAVAGSEAYASLDYQREDLKGLLGLLANQSGPEMAKVMEQAFAAVGRNKPLDASAFAQIDLKKGMNFTLLQVLSRGNSPQLVALNDVLAKFSSSSPVTQEDKQTLRLFGLYTNKEGHLINLTTNQPLYEVGILEGVVKRMLPAAAETVATRPQGVVFRSDTEVEVKKLASASLGNALHTLGQMNGVMSQHQATIESLDKDEQELSHRQGNISTQQQDVFKLQKQAQMADQVLQTLNNVFTILPADLNEKVLVELAHQDKLAPVNQVLEKYELAIAVDRSSGKVTFQHQGSAVDPAHFMKSLLEAQQQAANDHQKVSETLNNKTRALDEYQTETLALADTAKAKALVLKDSEQALAELKAQLLNKNIPELQAIRHNPALWQQLDAETQSQIEEVLAKAAQAVPKVDAVIQQGREVLKRTDVRLESVEKQAVSTKTLVSNSASLQERMKQTQTQAERLRERLEKELHLLQGEVNELISRADQLEATLSMTPRPVEVALTQLTDEWKKILEDTRALFDTAFNQQVAVQQIERHYQQDRLDKVKAELEYHLKELSKLDLRQEARVERQLHDGLKAQKTHLQWLATQLPGKAEF